MKLDSCPNKIKTVCSSCGLAKLCLADGLNIAELEALDKLVTKRRIVHRTESLFSSNDTFSKLYAVRSGSFKLFSPLHNDRVQITNFALPGELLGFEAINTGQYGMSAIALEASSVCEIPFSELLSLAAKIPTLQRHLFSMVSEKLGKEFSISASSDANQRLALFLLSLSRRFKLRGFSASKFNLSMSREDIGNYLGLATETISRVMTRFQEQNLVKVKRREIELFNLQGLKGIAHHVKA